MRTVAGMTGTFSAADPRLLAAARALADSGLLAEAGTASDAARLALAAADAVPRAARENAAVRAAADAARAAELSAGGAMRWRAAFVRVALAVTDAWERGGVDSSAMLGCLPEDLEHLVRACRHSGDYGVAVLDRPGALAELADAYRAHAYRADGEGAAVAELLTDADEQAWRDRYTSGVALLAANLLPPVELDDEQWCEFLNGDLEDLRAMGDEVRRTVDDADLAAAGITPAGDRWAGLTLD